MSPEDNPIDDEPATKEEWEAWERQRSESREDKMSDDEVIETIWGKV